MRVTLLERTWRAHYTGRDTLPEEEEEAERHARELAACLELPGGVRLAVKRGLLSRRLAAKLRARLPKRIKLPT